MTVIENRRTDPLDVRPDARALLVPGPGAHDVPAVVICAVGEGFGYRDPLREEEPGEVTGSERDVELTGRVGDLPTIDSWIVDLGLRDERVTLVTRTEVLCSVPLHPVPDGWVAAVAARGLLVVALRTDGRDLAGTGVPPRAMREPTLLVATVPVCLS